MHLIYWDSCTFIYRVQQIAPWSEKISRQLANVAQPFRLVITDLTRLECRVLPLRTGDQDMLARYDSTFSHPEIQRIPLSSNVFDLATQLRAEHGLKTPDALHLAAALETGRDEFWTNDHRLAKAAGNRLSIVTFN